MFFCWLHFKIFTVKIPIPHFNTDPFLPSFLNLWIDKKKKKPITMLCERKLRRAAKKAAVAFIPKLQSMKKLMEIVHCLGGVS